MVLKVRKVGRFGRGLELTKLSFKVIGRNKSLLLFPVLSGISLLLILSTFMVGFWFFPGLANMPEWIWVIIGFLIYVVLFFVSYFFQAALVATAWETLEGREAGVGFGIAKAWSRAGTIFKWAIISAIIGMILQALASRAGLLGSIAIRIVGAAWSIATYFVVPIIVFEEDSAWASVKKSWAVLKGSWGETFVSHLAVGLIFFLLAIPSIFILFALASFGTMFMIILGFVLMVVYIAFIMALHAAVKGVLQTALYRYAKTGNIGIDLPTWLPAPPPMPDQTAPLYGQRY